MLNVDNPLEIPGDPLDAELDALRFLAGRHNDHGRLLTTMDKVARAAAAGAVNTLIVDRDHQLPGALDDAEEIHTPLSGDCPPFIADTRYPWL